jgi:hypothetical protein
MINFDKLNQKPLEGNGGATIVPPGLYKATVANVEYREEEVIKGRTISERFDVQFYIEGVLAAVPAKDGDITGKKGTIFETWWNPTSERDEFKLFSLLRATDLLKLGEAEFRDIAKLLKTGTVVGLWLNQDMRKPEYPRMQLNIFKNEVILSADELRPYIEQATDKLLKEAEGEKEETPKEEYATLTPEEDDTGLDDTPFTTTEY